MALTRVTGKVFGGDAPLEEIGQFGSALLNNGSGLNTQDVATIQALPAYSTGWGSAVISSRNFPPIEEVNGVLKTISYQACYSLQAGVPVYDIDTDYGVGDIVKVVDGSTLTFYISQQTPNKGQSLDDSAYWVAASFLGTGKIGQLQYTLNWVDNLPENHVDLNGAEVDKQQYQDLVNAIAPDFATYQQWYGTASSADKILLPDFTNRYVIGYASGNSLVGGYVSAGLPTLTVSPQPNHTHGVGTYHIYGRINRVGRTSTSIPSSDYSGCFVAESSRVTSSGFNSSTNSYAHNIIMRAAANGTTISGESYNGFLGDSGAAGGHRHTITSTVPTTPTVRVDGIRVRVYTRYKN